MFWLLAQLEPLRGQVVVLVANFQLSIWSSLAFDIFDPSSKPTVGLICNLTLKASITTNDVCFVVCCYVFEASSSNTVDLAQTAALGPHFLPLYLHMSIKLVNICNRRLKQTTISDALFAVILGTRRFGIALIVLLFST